MRQLLRDPAKVAQTKNSTKVTGLDLITKGLVSLDQLCFHLEFVVEDVTNHSFI